MFCYNDGVARWRILSGFTLISLALVLAQPESLACQPELDVNPLPRAVCVRERCGLR